MGKDSSSVATATSAVDKGVEGDREDLPALRTVGRRLTREWEGVGSWEEEVEAEVLPVPVARGKRQAMQSTVSQSGP